LVTFHDVINNEFDVIARFVDTSGNVGNRIVINNENGNHALAYACFDGNYYLIIWHYFADWPSLNSFTAFGQFYDTSGSALGSEFSLELFGDNTAVFPVRYDNEIDKYFAFAISGTIGPGDLYGLFITP